MLQKDMHNNLANCGIPLSTTGINSSIIVTSSFTAFDGPVVEGSNVTFSCDNSTLITGPNFTKCTADGKWEPDPRGVKCEGRSFGHNHYTNLIIPLLLCF